MTKPRGRAGAAGLAAAAGVVLALAAAACTGTPTKSDAVHARAGQSKNGAQAELAPRSATLVSYSNCTDFLRQVKAEALREVGPDGLTTPGDVVASEGTPIGFERAGVGAPVPLMANAPAAAASPSSATATSGASVDYSTTNDQEQGVDEPDTVKTDGQLMVVLRQQPIGVQAVDVAGATPQLDGFLALAQLGQATGLFLVGEYAVVLGSPTDGSPPAGSGGNGVPPAPATLPNGINPGGPMIPAPAPAGALSVPAVALAPSVVGVDAAGTTTEAVVVSLADPDAPSVVKTFSFQGQLQGARLIDGQVVLALTAQPHLRWVYPANGTATAQKAATDANRAAIESSTSADWLPTASVQAGGARSATSSSGPACTRAYHPPVSAGLGTVSMASFNPAENSPGNEVTVMGDAQDVYASATQVYLATTNWGAPVIGCGAQGGPAVACCTPRAGYACPMVARPVGVGAPATSTTIYGFDITNPAAPEYLGSGKVPGTLIGSYAMSEYGGDLRVATSVGEPTPAPADGGPVPAQLSDNVVSVLQPENGALVTVGALHGLGRGEKIYAVLFQGDLGYVVTFNQLDPLYVVDLSNPAQPVLAGQVSLAGYSSFLQPLGNGLLAGVGQSVDSQLQDQGLQLEVFDVADPAQPELVSRHALGAGDNSAAEYDPHALLWWPQSDLLVLPVDNYSGNGPSSAAQVWSVSSSGSSSLVGAISQPQPSGTSGGYGYPEIERAVVVGDDIYTISEEGIMASDLTSLAQVAWMPFPAGPAS